MKDQVEELHQRHSNYSANSFQEALRTVLDLAEQSLENEGFDRKLLFEYEVEDSMNRTKIYFEPRSDSQIEYSDGKLQTPKAEINPETISERLKQIDGVWNSHSYDDNFDVILEEGPDRSFETIVDEVFEMVVESINQEEGEVVEIENAVDKYALRKNDSD